MDDPLLVGRFQRFGDLASDGEGFVERDRSPTDPVLERRAGDVFENERGGVAAFFEAVDRRDVRVVERRQDLRFALEAGQPFGVVHEGVGQDLQRDIAVQLGITGLVHFAHAACTDGGEDFVGAEGGAGLKWHQLSDPPSSRPLADSCRPVAATSSPTWPSPNGGIPT